MILKYNGLRGEHITGIPARDLLQEDIDQLVGVFLFNDETDAISQLTSKGLYSTVKKVKPKPIKTDDSEEIE